MKRGQIVVVTGLLLAAFGLGLWMGSRISMSRRVLVGTVVTMPLQSARVPGAPATSVPPPCTDIRNAGPLVGKSGCVAGLVLRAYSARTGNTFLDFCQDYRACPFISVIFASDKGRFGDLESLQGKRVEIRGDVISYQGHAEIIIRDHQQVRSAP
jgi:hypothetical protein